MSIAAWTRHHPALFGLCLVLLILIATGIGVLGMSQGHVAFSITWIVIALGAVGYNAVVLRQRASTVSDPSDGSATDGRTSTQHDRPTSPRDAEELVPASKFSAIAAAIAPVPFACFFWFLVLVTPENPVFLGMTALPAGALTAFLWNRGDAATAGWADVYPSGTGLASQFFHPFDPRKIDYAARRASLSARPLLVVWYLSRGLLISAWLCGLTLALFFGDGS